MRNRYLVISVLSILILLVSCEDSLIDDVFQQPKDVNEFSATDFTVSFESSFNKKQNTIYAATIPMVWNEIRNQLGAMSYFSSRDLKTINNSKGHEGVLLPDEYEVAVTTFEDSIIAKAYFRKSLPFEEPLTKYDEPLMFGDSLVQSFGFRGYNKSAKLNYYKNKKSFSVTLSPKDNAHEIILVMTPKRKNNFEDYFKLYNKEKGQDHYFNDDDRVEIPIIEFHLYKSFETIVGSSFISKGTQYRISEFYQRNAFVLNEKGAEVESMMEFATDASDEMEPLEPKMLVFNKPFVIFLKRKDADKPYFSVYISNSELLKVVKSIKEK